MLGKGRVGDIIWQCVSCNKCTYACPRDVNPEGVMKATAHWLELKGHTEKKPSMVFDEAFSEQVFATGAQGRRAGELLRLLRVAARERTRLMARNRSLDDIAARLDWMAAADDATLAGAAPQFAEELLALGEAILETWLVARGATPTLHAVEGFRLLALQRQGAHGEPSFNACRETCRELVYHHNLVRLAPAHAGIARRLKLGAMVARHLALFIGGKLEAAGLGEFCCAARPLRQREESAPPAEMV